MIPSILEYENNIVKPMPSAYIIPEVREILDKYGDEKDPYLMFIYSMSHPKSAYINIPEDEKVEAITYDIQETMGEFDYSDPLLYKAIDALKDKYITPLMAMLDELGQEMHRIRKLLKNETLTMGSDGNFRDRMALLKDIGKIASEHEKLRKQADQEMKASIKGDHELGEY